jgi:hypothetical protein
MATGHDHGYSAHVAVVHATNCEGWQHGMVQFVQQVQRLQARLN